MAVSLKVDTANMARQFRPRHCVLKLRRIQRKGAKAQRRNKRVRLALLSFPLRLGDLAFKPLVLRECDGGVATPKTVRLWHPIHYPKLSLHRIHRHP